MPNINNSIIDFNDFNAEPQLLRDIQDGKAIAFYSFAHLLLDTSGKPYTLPTGLYISGAYDTLQQLQSAFPTGNTNLYIVNADKYIYYWNGSAWTKGGTIDATYAFGVELQVPNTATNGTLTQEQFNQLSSNENAYILFNNERYLLMDKGHEADTWGYSHLGADITGAKIKVITINTSNRSWVLTDEEFVKDGTISTQKIQDGAVTTQKLSSDVSLQIRKNDFASRFNSDRLNILEAQINADKNTIEYTSDNEIEVTCNGANIIDCNAHFKKIQGRTRRKSLNLLKFEDVSNVTAESYIFSIKQGVISIQGTNNKQYSGINYGDVVLTYGKTYTLYCDNVPTGYTFRAQYGNANGMQYKGVDNSNKAISFTFDGLSNMIQLRFQAEVTSPQDFSKRELRPILVEGTYTADTMPPFEPYDNTLVNSKATFVSTGRNMFKASDEGEYQFADVKILPNKITITSKNEYGYLELPITIPLLAGEYWFGANVEGSSNVGIYITDSNKNTLSETYYGTGVVFGTFTITETEQKIRFGMMPTKANTTCTFTNIYISRKNKYEPYTESKSVINQELGAYDYIENGNLIKQTSEMITLNGSENWSIDEGSPNKRFVTYDKAGGSINDTLSVNLVTNSLLQSVTANHTWSDETINNMISISNGTYHIVKRGITTIEALKQWLASNPITLVYKKATPTITPIVVPNGIVSYKNGLTSQEIKGKYLPYKYTAKYVNGGAE